MSSAYTFSGFSLSIGGVPYGHVGRSDLSGLGADGVEFEFAPTLFEATFAMSPETTGAMPDCVKRTRRSRRRWRGKGSAWSGFFRALGSA